MLTRAALAGLVAAAALAVPAHAAPCDGTTVPQCLEPVIDRTGEGLRDVRDTACDLVPEPC